jgi:uncharacterized protein YgbK (DUF1537 family)
MPKNIEVNPELLQQVQTFVETKKTFHIDAFDMEDITEAVYGVRIEMLESANDTTHEYTVKNTVDKHDESYLKKAIADGHMAHWQYGVILSDLCRKGLLEPGEYFLRMSW